MLVTKPASLEGKEQLETQQRLEGKLMVMHKKQKFGSVAN